MLDLPVPSIADPSAVAELQRAARAGMTWRCTVTRPTSVAGPGGSQSVAWWPVAGCVDLPCAVVPDSAPMEGIAADAARVVERYRVRFDPTTLPAPDAIRATDRLSIVPALDSAPAPLVLDVVGGAATNVGPVTVLVRAERRRPGGV